MLEQMRAPAEQAQQMKPNNRQSQAPSSPAARDRARIVLLGAAMVAAALACLGLAALFRGHPSEAAPEPAPGPPPAEQTKAEQANTPGPAEAPANAGGHLPAVVSPAPVTSNLAAGSASTGLSGQLVASLASLNPASGPLTPEQAARWKQSLQSLVQQGAAAIPAIREFLARNTDVSFGSEAAAGLGYGSVRAALIDALAQIGGPDATDAMLQAMQTTLDPRELAVLAQSLDKLSPGQFGDQAVQAVRQLLAAAAAQPGLLADKDAAPLFEVLAKYGGANAVPVLEGANGRWAYYAAIALAQLPDGAGLASLVRLAQPPQNGVATTLQDPAVRALAQLSSTYPAALDALLQLARQNQIIPVTWAGIAPILAGSQLGFQNSAFDGTATPDNLSNLKTTHLSWGNQSFYTGLSSADLTADQVAQRLEVIQKLLSVTSDPAAQQALVDASASLAPHIPASSATPPGK
jgi:hypothetical protein